MIPKQYRLKPEAYTVAKRQTLMAVFFLTVLIALCFFLPRYLSGTPVNMEDQKIFGLYIILILAFVAVNIARLLKKKKKLYENYLLTIDKDTVTATQITGAQEMNFTWLEITRIIKSHDGGFIIYGGPDHAAMLVPPYIENPDQLEARLNEISPVIVNPGKKFLARFARYWVYIAIAAIVVFINSNNKIVICLTGPVSLYAFAWLFMLFNKTKQPDIRVKMIKWVFLVPAFGILYKMVLILTGIHLF